MRRLALAASVLLLAGCATSTPRAVGCLSQCHPQVSSAPPAAPVGPAPTLPGWDVAGRCGVERWPVKTATDPAVGSINLQPAATTVAALDALPRPISTTAARMPNETATYSVAATLTAFKAEADSDDHLVLTDGGQTLVAEIPHPSCAASSPLLEQITAARAAFDALVGSSPPTSGFAQVNIPVTVTGVAFTDLAHGQRGEGPADLELHPVAGFSR